MLYKSFVRSIIEYVIFISYPTRKDVKMKLERIQYDAIKASVDFRKSTSTNILIEESKLPLIEERAKFFGKHFICKTLSNNNLKTKTIIEKHFQVRLKKIQQKRLIKTCITEVLPDSENL